MATYKEPTFLEIEAAIKRGSAKKDKKDSRDYQYEEIMGTVEVPEEFSLRDLCSPVKNQGKRGTCVGFSATGILEFFNRAEHNDPNLDLSEEYLFKRIKEFDIEDYGYEGYGAYIRSACKAMQNWGTCLERTAPYKNIDDEDIWKQFVPNTKMDSEAKKYRVKSYLSVPSNREDLIKQAILTTKAPLLAGFKLWSSYREAKTNGGIIPMPVPNKDKLIGGHAMEIIGWKIIDGELYWELKNSWSPYWGDQGYIYWPAKAERYMNSVWSFVDLSTNPHVVEEEKIKANREQVSPYALESWDKAIEAGLVSGSSLPKDALTKEDFFVFKDRAGELDAILKNNVTFEK